MTLYLYAAGIAFVIYYFRRYWLSPWGVYIRHTETKSGGVFMTVRHVRWYPPFLNFERTFHRANSSSLWVEESSGWCPGSGGEFSANRQGRLVNMLAVAKSREAETEELLSASKVSK